MFPDRSPEASMNPTYTGIGTRPQQPSQGFAGHDKVLQSIRKDGRQITVNKSDGSVVQGRLIAHDNYTLSVDDGEHVRVIFKHAIDDFFATRRAS